MIALLFALAFTAPDIPLTTVARGVISDIDEPKQVLIWSEADWRALWKSSGSADRVPVIDFSTHSVAAVFLGTRPTSGFSVEIRRVRREGGELIVEYQEGRPAPGLITAQILTAPFHIVSLPRQTGSVRFVRVEAVPHD